MRGGIVLHFLPGCFDHILCVKHNMYDGDVIAGKINHKKIIEVLNKELRKK